MKILIIDDNPEQLISLKLLLKTKGHTILVAASGKEALAKLNAAYFEIDVVVTDYAMPGMNGLELLSEIREKYPTMPVIIMTAYGEKELLVSALRNGCDGFIEKPFTANQLLNELKRVELMIQRRGNYRVLSERIFKLIDTINDKLAVISGNTEFAMIGLAMSDPESAKIQLNLINEASKDISLIGEEMLKHLKSA